MTPATNPPRYTEAQWRAALEPYRRAQLLRPEPSGSAEWTPKPRPGALRAVSSETAARVAVALRNLSEAARAIR